jgi:hypothetical protein
MVLHLQYFLLKQLKLLIGINLYSLTIFRVFFFFRINYLLIIGQNAIFIEDFFLALGASPLTRVAQVSLKKKIIIIVNCSPSLSLTSCLVAHEYWG